MVLTLEGINVNELGWKLVEFRIDDAVNAAKREGARMAYDAKLRIGIRADLNDAKLFARRGNRFGALFATQDASTKIGLLTDPTMWKAAVMGRAVRRGTDGSLGVLR